jgi:Spy/CpxP family protein refolding chaperone
MGIMVSLAGPLSASDLATARPAFHEELADSWGDLAHTWDDLAQGLRDWGHRWREHLSAQDSREERPLISFMLRHREKLGLSAEQTRRLEQLRNEFQREAIRSEADLRIAEMDLAALLEAAPVDMGKVETKVREIERLRSDLRISRIRAIEKGKDLLSAEQRKTLQELMAGPRLSRLQPRPSR